MKYTQIYCKSVLKNEISCAIIQLPIKGKGVFTMAERDIIFTNFVKVGKPDKERTADLIQKAIGNKMTMTAFANKCGTSASTLSRILNGKTSRKCSDELLEAVFRNADPDSGITFDQLMEAQGMIPKLRNGRTRRFEQQKYEQDIEFILLDEFVRRGFRIGPAREKQIFNALNYPYRPDLSIITNAIDNKSDLTWHFEYWSLAYLERPSETDYWDHIKRIRQKILMNLGMMFMDMLKNDKMSFVVTEKYVYDTLIQSLHDSTLKVRVSIILVDLNEKCIKEEYSIPVDGIEPGIDILSVQNIDANMQLEEKEDYYSLEV